GVDTGHDQLGVSRGGSGDDQRIGALDQLLDGGGGLDLQIGGQRTGPFRVGVGDEGLDAQLLEDRGVECSDPPGPNHTDSHRFGNLSLAVILLERSNKRGYHTVRLFGLSSETGGFLPWRRSGRRWRRRWCDF